jgi:predicted RND superfamily exporter protein
MKKITEFLIRYKYLVLTIMIILTMLSGFFFTKVEVNDNMLEYIPEDIESIKGANIILENFNDSKTVKLLLKDVSLEKKDSVLDLIKKDNDSVINTDVFLLKTVIL